MGASSHPTQTTTLGTGWVLVVSDDGAATGLSKELENQPNRTGLILSNAGTQPIEFSFYAEPPDKGFILMTSKTLDFGPLTAPAGALYAKSATMATAILAWAQTTSGGA